MLQSEVCRKHLMRSRLILEQKFLYLNRESESSAAIADALLSEKSGFLFFAVLSLALSKNLSAH